jgi:hypothetical protein
MSRRLVDDVTGDPMARSSSMIASANLSNRKNEAETDWPCNRSGSPLPVKLKSWSLMTAICAKD